MELLETFNTERKAVAWLEKQLWQGKPDFADSGICPVEKGHGYMAHSKLYYQKLRDMLNCMDDNTIEDRRAPDFISRINTD